jgi:hypothetical protein
MKKLTQAQQTQQPQQKGGEAMERQDQQNQAFYFVTFPSKVSSSQAKEIIKELRKRYPGQAIFTPKPQRGKKVLIEIGGTLVIVTFPYINKNPNKQGEGEAPKQEQTGFTLKELIRNKS